MFTPIKDLDVHMVLPFLDHIDLYRVILTHKKIPVEFHDRLIVLKRFTFRSIEHFHVSELNNIRYAMRVEENMEEGVKQHIRMAELCSDTLGGYFMKLHHSNGTTQTIIYNREFKFRGNDTLVYRLTRETS